MRLREIPTLAAASAINADTTDPGALLKMRVAAELAGRDPSLAAAVIGPAPDTDDRWALNVLVGNAELIAAKTGIDTPPWTAQIPPLDKPWHPDGTPHDRPIRRHRAYESGLIEPVTA